MSENLDWGALVGDAEEAFAPLPPGTYDVVVHAAIAKTASTGKPMFMVTYKVTTGPQVGKTIINNITVTADNPRALFYFFNNMECMGVSKQVFRSSPPPSNEQIAQMLVGNPCRIKTSLRKYQNQDRDNVDEILPANSGAGVPSPSLPSAPAVAAAPTIPAPVATVPSVPSVPVAAPAPVPVAAPVAEAESTIAIPAPQNPAVPSPDPVAAPPAPAPAVGGTQPPLPPF